MKSIITAPAETPAKLSDILGKGCTCALRLYREYNYNFPNKEVRNPADRLSVVGLGGSPRPSTMMARAKGMSRRSKILPFTSHFTDVAGLFFLLLVSSAAQGKRIRLTPVLTLPPGWVRGHDHKAWKQMHGSG